MSKSYFHAIRTRPDVLIEGVDNTKFMCTVVERGERVNLRCNNLNNYLCMKYGINNVNSYNGEIIFDVQKYVLSKPMIQSFSVHCSSIEVP